MATVVCEALGRAISELRWWCFQALEGFGDTLIDRSSRKIDDYRGDQKGGCSVAIKAVPVISQRYRWCSSDPES